MHERWSADFKTINVGGEVDKYRRALKAADAIMKEARAGKKIRESMMRALALRYRRKRG